MDEISEVETNKVSKVETEKITFPLSDFLDEDFWKTLRKQVIDAEATLVKYGIVEVQKKKKKKKKPNRIAINIPKDHKDYELAEALAIFFSKKKWHLGGPIPPDLIYTNRNFNICNNIDLDKAIELGSKCISKVLENDGQLAKTNKEENTDIYIVTKVIRQCEKMGIQKGYIGGIFLLYLELCENVKLL